MTGTAMTEAAELMDIYGLEVIEVPTNLPCVRQDHDDEVYRTAKEKYDAIIALIEEARARQQPVLVGTVSIEKSEVLSEQLKKRNIPHQVLNARYHEQEAYIIAQAGGPGGVTSPPTWPAAGPTSSSAATSTCASGRRRRASRTRPSASARPPRSAPRSQPTSRSRCKAAASTSSHRAA